MLLLTFIISSATAAEWTFLSQAPWSRRDRFGAVVLRQRAFVLGGYDYQKHLNDVWSSADGSSWTQVTKEAAWRERSGHSVVTKDDEIFLMAGENSPIGRSIYFNDVWASQDGQQWKQFTSKAPWCKRTSASAVAFGSSILILGGVSETNDFLQDVWSSPDGRDWQELTAAAPWTGRWGFGAVVYQQRLLVMGGVIDYGPGDISDMWSSEDGRGWQSLGQAPWSGRDDFGLTAVAGCLYLVGGASYQKFNELWMLQGSNWSNWTLSQTPWKPRSGLRSLVLNQSLLIMGGSGKYVQDYYNDVWSLDLTAYGTWAMLV